jgi:hypothetical protein
VHDTADLEARGIPAAFVATREFADGADQQAKALGATPTPIYTEHPIQDRTDAEMTAIADSVADQVIASLVVTEKVEK